MRDHVLKKRAVRDAGDPLYIRYSGSGRRRRSVRGFRVLADVIFTQCWGPEFGKLLANSQCKDAAAKTCTRGDGSAGRCEAGECKVSRHSMSARQKLPLIHGEWYPAACYPASKL